MPRKSSKSKAAEQREEIKRNNVMPQETSLSFENRSLQSLSALTNYKVLSGNLHQGDNRFQYPGIQCTYISFYALISMRMKHPSDWNAYDIDSCILRGNDRFIDHCFKQQWQPKMLLVNELPKEINILGTVFECCQTDIDTATGTLAQSTSVASSNNLLTLDDAILQCFEKSDSCLLVCGGQTIAVAKRESIFFVFDPHSRGSNGMQHHSGNAVLVSFCECQSMIGFIRRLLIESLRLKPFEQFELVPMVIFEKQDDKSASIHPDISNKSYPEGSSQSELQSTGRVLHDQTQKNTTMRNPSMESYFLDQKRRDVEHRAQKVSTQSTGICSTRADYMRQYMSKRRENESFRTHDNLKAAERMKRSRSTDEGRQRHNKRSAEIMQKMLSTKEGRQKHNRRSAERMQKILSIEEERQKHNERSSERMKKMRSTEEGRLKHNKRSAKGMQKMLSTEEGRQKHNERSAKGMQKMLSTEEGRQKHNERSTEGMKKMLSTEKEGENIIKDLLKECKKYLVLRKEDKNIMKDLLKECKKYLVLRKEDKNIMKDLLKECKKYLVLRKEDKNIMKDLLKECKKYLVLRKEDKNIMKDLLKECKRFLVL